MMLEKNVTKATIEMEQIDQMMRGLGEKEPPSCFVDAEDLQDASGKNWLSKGRGSERDYTKFGSMRKINI